MGWGRVFPHPKGAEERALVFVPQQIRDIIHIERGIRQQLARTLPAHGGQKELETGALVAKATL